MHMDPRLWKLALHERLAYIASILLGAGAGALAVGQASTLSLIINRIFLENMRLDQLLKPLIILLYILIARPLIGFLGDLASQVLSQRVKLKMRSQLLEHIQKVGPGYTSTEQTGELAHVLIEGVDSLDAYFSQYLPGLALAFLVPISILIAVLRVDLLSGVVLMFTGPLIPFFMILIGSASRMLTRRHWRTLNRLSAYFLDIIQGLPTLKLLGRSREQIHQISRASEEFRVATMNVLRVTFLSALTLEMAATLSTAVIAVEIGLRLLYGRIGFEQALFVLLLAPEFYQPLRQLGARFHSGIAGVEAAESIFRILETPSSKQELVSISKNGQHSDFQEVLEEPESPVPLISFEGVSLAYQPGRTALQDISFQIQAGEKLAVVGPSGGGKSSLASILLRFVEPDAGRVLWAGKPFSEVEIVAWREKVTWVPQKPYLLNDTIEANLRVGRPSASRDELVQAAKLAQADDFIMAFPEGYATMVGERGVRLSAGEAQRIALARAFLKDAELVILDEATSHLDLENEAALEKAVGKLLRGRTVFVIAHRLSTVKQADRLLVLEGGSIQQVGSPEELLQQEGLYRKMVNESQWDHQPTTNVFSEYRQNEDILHSNGNKVEQKQVGGEFTGTKHTRRGRPTLFRLLRLGLSVGGWATLAVLAGAATLLSGVSLMGFSAYIIAAAALQPSIAVLQVPIVAVRAFGIGRGVFRYLERLISHQATFKLLSRLRVSFYSALEPLIPSRLLAYRSGDLLERIIGDIQTLENFFVRALAPPLSAFFSLSLVFIYLNGFSPIFGRVLLIFWLTAGVLVPALGFWLGYEPGKNLLLGRAQLKASAVDFFQGMPDLLAFNQSRRVVEHLEKLSAQQLRTVRTISGALSAQAAATSLFSGLGTWTVLLLAAPFVASGHIPGVYLAVIVLVVLTSFEAIQPLPLAAQTLSSDLQAARRLYEVIDAEPVVVDPRSPLPMPAQVDLRVRDLAFSYPGSSPILQGVSFDLHPGKRLAVVGPSGSGKSTLANLLLRLWDAGGGKILLNGMEIQKYAQEAVRAHISIIPQQVYLFNVSIADNIWFGYPHASEQAVVLAAQQASIDDFILGLPDCYDTWVGEQGVQLSAGERQRVAIARALLRPSSLLIMDEATANLDTLTEQRVLQSIFGSSQEKSILMITHRLVGMEEMDEILVLDKGRVVERGSHLDLLNQGGIYRRMWELQRSTLL